MNFLTSIRGLAAFLVLLFHIQDHLNQLTSLQSLLPIIENGYLAVDFFFVLSGFIIAYKYHPNFKSDILKNYYLFIAKRIARIYPLHIFALLCFVIFPLGLYITEREIGNEYSTEAFIFKALLVDLWLFNSAIWQSWNLPSWTISGEFFAYLTFPFFIWTFQRSRIYLKIAFLALALILLFAGFSSQECPTIGSCITQLGLLRCAVEFWLGSAVWYFYSITKDRKPLLFIAAATLSLIVLSLCFVTKTPNYFYVPILFASTLYGLTGFRSPIHRLLELKPLIYLGDISYSVYLLHTFVRDLTFKLFLQNGEYADVKIISLYVILTLLLSAATYSFVEVPFRERVYRWMTRATKRPSI